MLRSCPVCFSLCLSLSAKKLLDSFAQTGKEYNIVLLKIMESILNLSCFLHILMQHGCIKILYQKSFEKIHWASYLKNHKFYPLKLYIIHMVLLPLSIGNYLNLLCALMLE